MRNGDIGLTDEDDVEDVDDDDDDVGSDDDDDGSDDDDDGSGDDNTMVNNASWTRNVYVILIKST